ncbi:MAG TPA: Ppx/GppA family phosphatase [Nocardioides sp.]|nr:Ppx/GppA family phosphatase [Nocardioides sp.]
MALTPGEVVATDELYLLSAAPETDVVKVRNELMDVKRLHQVDDDGLELWTPVMKVDFPLSSDDLRRVAEALRVELPTQPARASYRLSELLDEVVRPHPDLLAVEVTKKRHRYVLDGCMAELTEVRASETATRTVAIEDADPARVRSTVLGLAGPVPNVNFARGLKALLGFGAERFAVIDVGTNSVKFNLSDRDQEGGWHMVVDRAEITRLGEGLQETGRLNPEPMARTVRAIAAMASEAVRLRVAAIAAVGTAGLRMAANGSDFVATVADQCGVAIEVVSGEDEARLAYQAATAALDVPGSRVVFDTGGGSSQFTFGDATRVDERFSLQVGAVRFTEKFGLDGEVSRAGLAAALEAIAADLTRLDGRSRPDALVGMGGAVANLAAVRHALAEYDADVVQGTVLDRSEIDRQIELYRTRTAEERRGVTGLQPQRADIILAGACIVRTVLDKLGVDALTVSDRGLRHGVLAERFARRPGPGSGREEEPR